MINAIRIHSDPPPFGLSATGKRRACFMADVRRVMQQRWERQ